jgi:hypothetical protein
MFLRNQESRLYFTRPPSRFRIGLAVRIIWNWYEDVTYEARSLRIGWILRNLANLVVTLVAFNVTTYGTKRYLSYNPKKVANIPLLRCSCPSAMTYSPLHAWLKLKLLLIRCVAAFNPPLMWKLGLSPGSFRPDLTQLDSEHDLFAAPRRVDCGCDCNAAKPISANGLRTARAG